MIRKKGHEMATGFAFHGKSFGHARHEEGSRGAGTRHSNQQSARGRTPDSETNMKKHLFLMMTAAVMLFGAGCATKTVSNPNRIRDWNQNRGLDLIRNAEVQSASPVVVYRPGIGRRFRSAIAPTFTDYNGSYRMGDGSSIEIQMGVSGTPESDREQLKKLSRLSEFDEGEWNGWTVTAAYDTQDSRWMLRAAQKDLAFQEDGYHVIECLATSTSGAVFWDGCRTFLESAQVLMQ